MPTVDGNPSEDGKKVVMSRREDRVAVFNFNQQVAFGSVSERIDND